MRSDPDVVAVRGGGMPSRLGRTATGVGAVAPAPSLGCVLLRWVLPASLPAALPWGTWLLCFFGCGWAQLPCCEAQLPLLKHWSLRLVLSPRGAPERARPPREAPAPQSRCALWQAAPAAALCRAVCAPPGGGWCADAAAGAARTRRRLPAAGLLAAQPRQPRGVCHVGRQRAEPAAAHQKKRAQGRRHQAAGVRRNLLPLGWLLLQAARRMPTHAGPLPSPPPSPASIRALPAAAPTHLLPPPLPAHPPAARRPACSRRHPCGEHPAGRRWRA